MEIKKQFTVITLEENFCTLACCECQDDKINEISEKVQWNSESYLEDENGQRLVEEIVRRIRNYWETHNLDPHSIVISLPGTIKNSGLVESSSRLNIREPLNLAKSISNDIKQQCFVFHDLDSILVGEIKQGECIDLTKVNSLVYIFVDEGIGSKIIINGETYHGTGLAGSLGRLIVQPEGAYLPALRTSGSLEIFSSRPGVSNRLVEVYHSELGKTPLSTDLSETSKFRQALKAASRPGGSWAEINYDRIVDGIDNNDPIALHVMDRASQYMGYAINSIITLINPQLLVLAGNMITKIPSFSDNTIRYARQYSWPLAWNKTEIKISKAGRDLQIIGSVELANELINQNGL